MNDLPRNFKVVRTDRELQMPQVDARLRDAGAQLLLLPDGAPEAVLAHEVADADLLLMCYTPVSAAVIAGATRLKAIVKYGVGIDAIDIGAARQRGIPVVNVPGYAEETVAEGAFALLMALFKRFKPLQHTDADRRLGLARGALAGPGPGRQDPGPGGPGAHRPLHGAHGRGVSHARARLRPACRGRGRAGRRAALRHAGRTAALQRCGVGALRAQCADTPSARRRPAGADEARRPSW